ncbi:hypothetical protein D049_3481, partial [Vibrio parahaemolyticus VPTS-2010]
MPLPSTL